MKTGAEERKERVFCKKNLSESGSVPDFHRGIRDKAAETGCAYRLRQALVCRRTRSKNKQERNRFRRKEMLECLMRIIRTIIYRSYRRSGISSALRER